MRPAGRGALPTHAVRLAIVFAAAGAASRFSFRTFETRWQIAIFWAVVLAYQLLLRPATGRRLSIASTMLDLGCVAAAIIAMKVAIEGQL